MPPESDAVVFLGAGASAEAGVPTSFAMAPRIVAEVREAEEDKRGFPHRASVLTFICGALIGYDAAAGMDPFGGVDVERVFAAVSLLAERRDLEVTPFVGMWHPSVEKWDQRRRQVPRDFDRSLREALEQPPERAAARFLLSSFVGSQVRQPAYGDTYRDLATMMLNVLRDLVHTERQDVGYLEPLVLEGGRDKGLTIATLNYDLSIEQAASAAHVPLTTGIEHWIKTGKWRWPARGVRLIKLHGSINWVWEEERREKSLPRNVVRLRTDANRDDKPALVFGLREKLRAEGPFLGMLAEFERLLGRAAHLVAIGYSFRDDHVNEVIRRWLASDTSRVLEVADPIWDGGIPVDEPAFTFQMIQHLPAHIVRQEGKTPPPASRLVVNATRCSAFLKSARWACVQS